MLALHYRLPTFTLQEATRLASEHYGLAVTARPLPSERDQNFLLTTESGEQFVLKFANTAEALEHLDLQNRLLDHLTARASGLAFPRVVLTRAGAAIPTAHAPDGAAHLMRLLTFIPGQVWARVRPHTPALWHSLGATLGQIDSALLDFDHPSAHRALKWDVARAAWVRDQLHYIADPARRALVEKALALFDAEALPHLRHSIIYNDANDYNLLVNHGAVSVIDFGDVVHTATICELAIACAYALMGQPDPLAAAVPIVQGYHAALPLTEAELAALFPLILARLCITVTNAAMQAQHEPADDYQQISARPAWDLLERLMALPERLALYAFRAACGLPAHPAGPALTAWLQANAREFAPIVEPNLATHSLVFDLSVGSLTLGSPADYEDSATFTRQLSERMQAAEASVGVGRYAEARPIYTTPNFRVEGNTGPEWRTVHLGIDLFLEPGAPVFAPLEGVVHSFADNAVPLGYGPVVILQHTVEHPERSVLSLSKDAQSKDAPLVFFTLYGHLSRESLSGLQVGQVIRKGQRLGAIGAATVNGGWPPHVHFQIITDLLGLGSDEFPGVARPGERAVWLGLCPDPNLMLGIPAECFPPPEMSAPEILAVRREHLGHNLSLSYSQPLHIVRGYKQYLYSAEGRRYLDAVNNVAHVGHSHPRVVRAAHAQMLTLNTNSRYLHPNIVRYAERLLATLPEPLRVVYFVCSGSEANELALRLARTYTQSKETIVLDLAYHGNTNALVEISPYKYERPGGRGPQPHVHKVPIPDVYRGPHRAADPRAGEQYAASVGEAIGRVQSAGGRLSAFIAESLMGSAGQIPLAPGYLAQAYELVRAAGGVCIADEVQVGMGRVGSHWWGFELQGVVPDIVTLGKPLGNGHPLAAVVTTPALAAAFDNGMEYFNTFGGNPVSCAVGLAVLEVIEDEGLRAHAVAVGDYLQSGLRELQARHELIGDVRGAGLFVGVEFVKNRETRERALTEAAYVVNRLKEHGILLSADFNSLKIKPPLPFDKSDADFLVEVLDGVLGEDEAQPKN